MRDEEGLFATGTYKVGCNYWASHAGTAMWSDWRPDIVRQDLERLAGEGLQVLRVFPLWSDFQPLTLLRTGGGEPREYRFGEQPLPDDEYGRAGVSRIAMSRFAEFLDIAGACGLKLIVGLVTGHMSGRLFAPPAFVNSPVLSDPAAVMWQLRFIKFFVRSFKDHPAVAAWEPGNECNCMPGADSREEAWRWTAAVIHAVKSVDPLHPVISGMHSLAPRGIWTIQDQGELTDVLTTHPYPYFTPYCGLDPIDTMRNILHAPAESCFYADIGGRPCLVEEINTIGPMFGSDEVVARSARAGLFSTWAHDCLGFLWWCAHDQTQLAHAPYAWSGLERELGLLRTDGTAKPVLKTIGDFRNIMDGLSFARLPRRIIDGVCILTEAQDNWAAAFGSFLLATQAGMEIEFSYCEQPFKEAPLYFMPCISGQRVIGRDRWLALLEKVANGAMLYISYLDGFLSGFEDPTGLRVSGRWQRKQAAEVTFQGLEGGPRLNLGGPIGLSLLAERACILGSESNGNPVFTCSDYGKGKVYFLGLPLEIDLATRPGVFTATDEENSYWCIYSHLALNAPTGRAIRKSHPQLGVTEHPFDRHHRAVVLVNYMPEPMAAEIGLAPEWAIEEVVYGVPLALDGNGRGVCRIPANDGMILTIAKNAARL